MGVWTGDQSFLHVTRFRLMRSRWNLESSFSERRLTMRVLILGGDGYLGWPTAMRLASRGDAVLVVDNYLRRTLATETGSHPLVATPALPERAAIHASITGLPLQLAIGDCTDQLFMDRVFSE